MLCALVPFHRIYHSYSDGFSGDILWKSCKCKFSSRVVCMISTHQLHLQEKSASQLKKHFSESNAPCKPWTSCTVVNSMDSFEKKCLILCPYKLSKNPMTHGHRFCGTELHILMVLHNAQQWYWSAVHLLSHSTVGADLLPNPRSQKGGREGTSVCIISILIKKYKNTLIHQQMWNFRQAHHYATTVCWCVKQLIQHSV